LRGDIFVPSSRGLYLAAKQQSGVASLGLHYRTWPAYCSPT